MPEGGSSTSQEITVEKIYLSPVGLKKGSESTYFSKKQYDTDVRKYVDAGDCSWVTGYLDKITKGSFTSKQSGEEFPTYQIHIVEPDAQPLPKRYIISGYWGSGIREVLNRLAYCVSILAHDQKIQEMVTIGVYRIGEVDVFSGFFAKYGNCDNIKDQLKCEKAWSRDQTADKVKEVILNNKKVYDYTLLDQYYEYVMNNMINPAIVRRPMPDNAPEAPVSQPQVQQPQVQQPQVQQPQVQQPQVQQPQVQQPQVQQPQVQQPQVQQPQVQQPQAIPVIQKQQDQQLPNDNGWISDTDYGDDDLPF